MAALLRPYAELDDRLLAQTLTYINLVVKWNSRINLTAVRGEQEMVRRHFGESFFAAAKLLAREASSPVVDVGSGAGFPGLPLAMWATDAPVTLIESHGKKAVFLNEVIRALELGNARVFNGRAEDYSDRAELVTMRGVEKFKDALASATLLVADGGRLALMIGAGQVKDVPELTRQIQWQNPVMVPGGHSRVLLVGTKPVKVE